MSTNARAYPGGRWWKFDFHTHTPASRDTAWEDGLDGSSGVTPEAWLLQFMKAEVDCVAVTDHNSGRWIDPLKEAYEKMRGAGGKEFREIHIFPGVELSVSGGVHLLVLLDKDRGTPDIDSLLGKVDYEGTKGESDGVTRRSLTEVLEAVRGIDGIAIPAHADQGKGLLELRDKEARQARFDAKTIEQIFRNGEITAMEVVDRSTPKPQIYEQARCGWTEVLGSDCHCFSGDRAPGTLFTWVKMGEPTLEGLRLALLDGAEFSVRRSDAGDGFSPHALPAHFIEEIEVEDARYMGRGGAARLKLNPGFNALIGGRGTGKSTVVHALRLAYRREAELRALSPENETRVTFEQFTKSALDDEKSGRTKIAVTLMREGNREKLLWRQDGSGETVQEEEGGWAEAASQVINAERFPIRIFSQGQIVSLAGEDQRALLNLVDEAGKVRPLQAALEEAIQGYLVSRARIRELEAKLSQRPTVEARLLDIGRKLASFDGQAHSETRKEYQLRSRQSREIERQLNEVAKVAERLRTEADAIRGESVAPGLFEGSGQEEAEALGIVGRLHSELDAAAESVRDVAAKLEATVQDERERQAATKWYLRSVQATTRYKELSQRLKDEGVEDPNEYEALVLERQSIEQDLARLDGIEAERASVAEHAKEELARIREQRWQICLRREEFLAKTLADNPYVRICVTPCGRNPKEIERQFREVLGLQDGRFEGEILTTEDGEPKGGLVHEYLRELPEAAEKPILDRTEVELRLAAMKSRIKAAMQGTGNVHAKFTSYLLKEADRRPEFLDRLDVWCPEDSLLVKYSQRGDGKDFKSIQQASAGQRAAAMLAFLLVYGEEPLVLDQPEDDLDNHLIYGLVVKQIRTMKQHRQLIVVTHNPNIVVNGDAELVLPLDFIKGQCRVRETGSLQDAAVREEVCRVMEGGREAFLNRYRRIGREASGV